MAAKMKKTYFPTTRFVELAARGGGITQDAAVESALQSIESSRAESDDAIVKSIAAIESIVYAPHVSGVLSEPEMRSVLRHADQIVTLAGMFCYEWLDIVTRSLCDITDGLLSAGMSDAAPVIVHVQALRMMAPGAPALAPDQAERVLEGLKKVQDHYQFSSLSNARDNQDVGEPSFDIN